MSATSRKVNPSSTGTWKCLSGEWRQLTNTSSWTRHLDAQLNLAGLAESAITVVNTINTLNGPNRYMPPASRAVLGRLVCAAPESEMAMRAAMQAALFSLTPSWMSRKFRVDADTDTSVASYLTFAFIELSKRQSRARQRDPLACIRLNATNRAASAMQTYAKSTGKDDYLGCLVFDDELELLLEAESDQESFDFMTESWATTGGIGTTEAALTVLHDSFGLSFDDLAQVSAFSRATVHRKVSASRRLFRQSMDNVA